MPQAVTAERSVRRSGQALTACGVDEFSEHVVVPRLIRRRAACGEDGPTTLLRQALAAGAQCAVGHHFPTLRGGAGALLHRARGGQTTGVAARVGMSVIIGRARQDAGNGADPSRRTAGGIRPNRPDGGIVRSDVSAQSGDGCLVLAAPEVARIEAAGAPFEAQVSGTQPRRQRRGAAIEHRDGVAAIVQRLDQHVARSAAAQQGRHAAQRVLIDRQHRAVSQDAHRGGRQPIDVGAENQRRGHHRPQRQLTAAFRERHAGVAADDEIRVVPVAGSLKAAERQVIGVVPQDAGESLVSGSLAVVIRHVRAFAPELAVAADPAEDVIP